MKCILAIAVLLICPVCSFAQQAVAFANVELYQAVVNRLFQRDVPARASELVLRYTGSDRGEMQLLVREAADGGVIDITIWELPPGSRTIWDQLDELTTTHPTWDLERLARSIIVNRRSMLVPESSLLGKIIQNERPKEISLTGDDSLYLDHSQYEVTVSSLSRDISVVLRGPQGAESSLNPLIRWMGQVRAQVERQ